MPPADRISLAEFMGRTPSKKKRFMYALGLRIQARWKKLARQQLSDVSAETRRKYLNAVELASYSEDNVVVRLNNKFAAMFEQGLGPGGVGTYGVFDMRKFLLGSQKRGSKWPKQGKKGKWRPIPMMRTKGQMMAAADQSMQQAPMSGATRTAKLKRIEDSLSNMKGTVIATRKGKPVVVQMGSRMPSGRVPIMRPTARSTVAIPRQGPVSHAKAHPHATDPFAGAIKVQGAYGKGGKARTPTIQTAGYLTFRVISYGGKPWYHPGIRPRKIARMVKNQLKDIIPNPTSAT